MTDPRLHWEDFKRRVKECAMAWYFRNWLHTVVYGGPQWLRIVETLGDGFQLKREEDSKQKEGEPPVQKMSTEIMKIMGYTSHDVEFFQTSVSFVDVVSMTMEPPRQGLSRQKLWTWMVKSLHGPKTQPGPFYYLVDEVHHYDVASLFQELVRVADTPTILSQADDLETVFQMTYKPGTDLFVFLGELRKAVRKIGDANETLPEECRVHLPDSIVRAKLIRAMKHVPMYKAVLDSLLVKTPDEWKDVSSADLYRHLEQISANNRDLSRGPNQTQNDVSTTQANTVTVDSKPAKQRICFDFSKTGTCARVNCKFAHEKKGSQATPPAAVQASKGNPPRVCKKCGSEAHEAKDCKFAGKCSWCGRLGHKEAVCNQKKTGKPKALLLDVDGVAVQACLFTCGTPSSSNYGSPTGQPGKVQNCGQLCSPLQNCDQLCSVENKCSTPLANVLLVADGPSPSCPVAFVA